MKREHPKIEKDFEKLVELCVDIFAHCQNDYEITLSGNGTNACEASNVALSILDTFYGDGRKWRRANQQRIDTQALKLRKLYGDS